MKANLKKLMIAVALLSGGTQVWGYGFTPWTGMLGEKTLGINPFFYNPLKDGYNGTSADTVLGYGFSSKMDMMVNLASVAYVKSPSDVTYGGSYIMPRYDVFGNNNILAVRLGTLGSDMDTLYAEPNYHHFSETDSYAIEFNLAAFVPTSTPGSTNVWATLTPVYKFVKDKFYAFVELNPNFLLGDGGGFDMTVAPGFWMGFGDGAKHQISVSVPISGLNSSVGYGVNFWYYTSTSL